MSRARVKVIATQLNLRLKLREWLGQVRYYLNAHRLPLHDQRLWVVFGLIILITIAHNIIEAGGFAEHQEILYLIPITLFLVPVIYATQTFGFVGGIATALLITVITIPNLVLSYQGLERSRVLFLIFIINAAAFFVGQRVDREKNAWQQTDAAANALRSSRMKYLSLFESSPIAILVLDFNGIVLEANPAASILFDRDKATLEGVSVAELVGTSNAQKLLGSYQNAGRQVDSLVLKLKDGSELYLEPTRTEVSDGQGNIVIQVLFRDVTQEHDRQAGLRAYAAYVMHAQEEERQRIAQELHDATIQSLVLLYRRLDSMQSDSESLPPSLSNGLREARETAEEVVKELRDFTKALRPPVLNDLGIVSSVRRLLVDFTERSEIKDQLKVVGKNQRLPPDTELGMFRIAQEALRNVEHHAQATRVAVTITFTKEEVRLEVVDNGVGFSMAPVPGDRMANSQLGLISMQERAELLGGKLEIQSSPGNGTRVTVSIPVADAIPEIPAYRLER